MSGIADDSLPTTMDGLIKSFYLTDYLPIPFFGFLQASFLLIFISFVVIILCRRVKAPFFIAGIILFGLLIWGRLYDWSGPEIFGFYSAIRWGFYFLLGIIYCEYFEKINRRLPLDSRYAFVILLIAWCFSFYIWEDTEFKFIASVLGIAMCVSFAKLLVRYKAKFLDHLIGANYIIFLLSWYFNVLFQQVLAHYISLPWWVHTLLSLSSGIYIPWLFYRYLQKNMHGRPIRIISFLLGQSLKTPSRSTPTYSIPSRASLTNKTTSCR